MVRIHSSQFSGYCGVRCFNHFTKNNIKPSWVGENRATPKYGHYSTTGENEISGVTTLVYGFGNYPTKNKLHYGSVAYRLVHSVVARESGVQLPIESLRQFNSSCLT